MTITYEYDQGGNILNKKIHPYSGTETLQEAIDTKIYQYENTEWKDQLTTYNNKLITYDAIGNPLTYDGNTYSWQNGRQLAGITNEEKGQTITYKYNDNGIRTEKTVNETTTTYYLSGSKVIYEKTGDNVIYYSYDEAGSVIGLNYNGEQYYYKKNLQGDIIGILDSSLNQIAKYNYDAWGKVISIIDSEGNTIEDQTHIANINPYRYRGYRYDSETELYYLQSRYYSPEWGRFINVDTLVSTGQGLLSHNIYIYCDNNFINNMDPSGNLSIKAIIKTVKKGYPIAKNAVKFIINTTKGDWLLQ